MQLFTAYHKSNRTALMAGRSWKQLPARHGQVDSGVASGCTLHAVDAGDSRGYHGQANLACLLCSGLFVAKIVIDKIFPFVPSGGLLRPKTKCTRHPRDYNFRAKSVSHGGIVTLVSIWSIQSRDKGCTIYVFYTLYILYIKTQVYCFDK